MRTTLFLLSLSLVVSCTSSEKRAQEVWWSELRELCGSAFSGRMVSTDPADDEVANEIMVMHVRECSEERIRIPFHIGDQRSRTWVLSRGPKGIELKHDHRHADGREDQITQYGGHTALAKGDEGSTQTTQYFPADTFSLALFDEHEIPESKSNVWSMELFSGERFSYVLRRPERHFQVDFDLSTPIETPPAPWGYES